MQPGIPDTPDNFQHEGERIFGTSLADAFNNFFIQQASQNEINSNQNCIESMKGSSSLSSLFFAPTNCAEVFSCMNTIKNSKTVDATGLQITPIKHVLHLICQAITHIYNLILSTAVFPKSLQTARVIPVFKSGDKNLVNNYRPISILPVFSKGIDKLMHGRVLSFFNKHNLLLDFQHGFRKNRSTETALLTQKEIIIAKLQNKEIVAGIYIDFTKAFDLINHRILLHKMETYGVRGKAQDLMKSYLSHRTQYVDFKNSLSSIQTISAGVPQGSILGPLLFLIYLNDIVYCTTNSEFVSYADDTSVFISGKSERDIEKKASRALDALDTWTKANCLKINTKKTKIVLYIPKRKVITKPINVSLSHDLVEIVDSVKILGVIFSNHLTWNDHIDYVRSKISSAVGVMTRLRTILPVKVRLLIYNSLVLSLLQYCSSVWSTTGITNLSKLHLLQKRAVRCIAGVPYYFPTRDLFLKYEILPVFALYDYRLLITFKWSS